VRLFSNTRIYERIGGFYDASLGFWSREVRRQAAVALDVRKDERLLIIGVGTGMELEHLPARVRGAGVDLSSGMLQRAHRRRAELGMHDLDLRVMDARTLHFPDDSFDAVYLPLILTVVEDGTRVLAEAARVAAPGAGSSSRTGSGRRSGPARPRPVPPIGSSGTSPCASTSASRRSGPARPPWRSRTTGGSHQALSSTS
jgi:ubiquinone/menaquinone biosynthesis C-methylase UbiE